MPASHEIRYTSHHTGQPAVHQHSGSDGTATGWAESLARDHGCKAECVRVNADGTRTHVASYGADRPK